MSSVDELLSQRRRGELSAADERRLQIAVQTSPEHQLSLLAGEAFDRAGAPQPGDAALVRKIVRQVEGEWSGTFQRVPARRALSRWVSIPLLVAGAAAAAFGGYRAIHSLQFPPDSKLASQNIAIHVPLPAPALLPELAPAVVAPEDAVRLPEPVAPAAVAPPSVSAAAVPHRHVSVVPGRAIKHNAASGAAELVRPSTFPVPAAQAPAAPEAPAAPAVDPNESARELFRRASRLRASDWEAASSLYEQLTLRFADAHEAGVAEMALGKHALAEGRSDEALRWFRAYQLRAGGEQAAEALWGEARALESIGERAHAQAIWRRLIEQYPASAYAAAAREQLGP